MFKEGDPEEKSNVQKFAHIAADGKTCQMQFHSFGADVQAFSAPVILQPTA
ncbi:hypothetical protein AvCA_08900 [Azotobacter vinelandii CA]|uniref:Uncharacterized protein n=2 Tax=Azotobacter vinelandii TaxID=354 RepID=C1DMV0_AZOVD|nr:hypothetical protein [Azotobacter vinelandii]ACO77130.1 hypothetical protein Avin_08900 [Azotobacter vinelandii DJ]AGK15479.1 hypothetical protein AvCA_08900 [Azotobacter vinelandii CA]AGK19574.1 hypothetical protein AvCA6_08900 [Azotobacter vinelandii CA6]WKN22853.1 hypothetical protein AVAEIV_000861 [Azotobacter vinelandii]